MNNPGFLQRLRDDVTGFYGNQMVNNPQLKELVQNDLLRQSLVAGATGAAALGGAATAYNMAVPYNNEMNGLGALTTGAILAGLAPLGMRGYQRYFRGATPSVVPTVINNANPAPSEFIRNAWA